MRLHRHRRDLGLPDTVGHAAATDDEPIPTLPELGFEPPTADVPSASPGARRLLESLLESDVYRYDDRRDYPADGWTSRLSPHLKFGTIGRREVDAQVRGTRDAAAGADRESVVEVRSQHVRREFCAHGLSFNPEVVTENYRAYDHPIDRAEAPEGLAPGSAA